MGLKLETHVLGRGEGLGRGNVVGSVLADHVQRKDIYARSLGSYDLVSLVIQAKGFGVSHLRGVRCH
jgi:hypothetical protein